MKLDIYRLICEAFMHFIAYKVLIVKFYELTLMRGSNACTSAAWQREVPGASNAAAPAAMPN
jgi:hypothetical protein